MHDRVVKRNLSRLDKTTIIDREGLALVLPFGPDTEIEELIEIGFKPGDIHGIEHDWERYIKLVSHYRDLCPIHHADVFDFMRDTRNKCKYTYIHLDLCGHLKNKEVNGLRYIRNVATHGSRVRVSLFRGRRLDSQMRFEEELYHSFMRKWCHYGIRNDIENYNDWIALNESLMSDMRDTSKLIVAIVLHSLLFSDYTSYDDVDIEEVWNERPRADTLVPGNIIRYEYSEPGMPNHMITTWFDLFTLEREYTNAEIILRIFNEINFYPPSYNEATA